MITYLNNCSIYVLKGNIRHYVEMLKIKTRNLSGVSSTNLCQPDNETVRNTQCV